MKKNIRTTAFKKKVALEALKESKTVNELAKEFEVSPIQIRQWKKELVDGCESIFESKKKKKESSDEHVAMLEQKVGQLVVQIDWFKKKLMI